MAIKKVILFSLMLCITTVNAAEPRANAREQVSDQDLWGISKNIHELTDNILNQNGPTFLTFSTDNGTGGSFYRLTITSYTNNFIDPPCVYSGAGVPPVSQTFTGPSAARSNQSFVITQSNMSNFANDLCSAVTTWIIVTDANNPSTTTGCLPVTTTSTPDYCFYNAYTAGYPLTPALTSAN